MNEVTLATCCISPTARWRTIAPFSFSSVYLAGHNGKETNRFVADGFVQFAVLTDSPRICKNVCSLFTRSQTSCQCRRAVFGLLCLRRREFRSSASTYIYWLIAFYWLDLDFAFCVGVWGKRKRKWATVRLVNVVVVVKTSQRPTTRTTRQIAIVVVNSVTVTV